MTLIKGIQFSAGCKTWPNTGSWASTLVVKGNEEQEDYKKWLTEWRTDGQGGQLCHLFVLLWFHLTWARVCGWTLSSLSASSLSDFSLCSKGSKKQNHIFQKSLLSTFLFATDTRIVNGDRWTAASAGPGLGLPSYLRPTVGGMWTCEYCMTRAVQPQNMPDGAAHSPTQSEEWLFSLWTTARFI